MVKTPEELYQERSRRISDAIQLKVPDRVPVEMAFDYFPAKYAGISCEAAYYDYEKWIAANKKTIVDFAPDAVFWLPEYTPGLALEYLNPLHLKWPGHGVPSDHSHQFVEGEWMKPDEYADFLSDHSDYMLRGHLPSVIGAMKPLSQLPPISSLGYGYFGALVLAESLAKPEVAGAIENLLKAGRELAKWSDKRDSFNDEIRNLGFPVNSGGMAQAPFDIVSDYLRGMQGTMMDMFRQPDNLLAAIDYILNDTLERAIPAVAKSGNKRLFMPLHRGSDGFMSLKQFETFYWPSLKKVIISAVEAGLTPGVFFEGVWTNRLEYLLELPKGKVLCHFDATDLFKAKEVLGGHLCIKGNVPASLLQTGSTQDVKDCCQQLIDIVGKGGGYIMCNRSAIDEAKPENLKTMIDFTQEYGVYR
ncbi:uroporphyrinogen decarboxylase family protein [Chloroflexota bacterium]